MIKNGLDIRAFHRGKEIKIIELENLHFFFDGLNTLANEWKVEPFTKLWGKKSLNRTDHSALNVIMYLIYKLHFGKGWEINIKRFKNELLFKTKNPKVLLLESDYLTLTSSKFDSAISYLKNIGFIKTNSRNSYFDIDNTIVKYCIRLGDYLFHTDYCERSFKENSHYFGGSNSIEHQRAYKERKQMSEGSLH
jgi:hypothetical protein